MTIKELMLILKTLPEDATVKVPNGYKNDEVTDITNTWYDRDENELWLTNFDN